MRFAVDDELILTDELNHPGLRPGVFVLIFRGKPYGPCDRLPGYRTRAGRLVATWALGGRGRRTDDERLAGLRFLAQLPAGRPPWTFPRPK